MEDMAPELLKQIEEKFHKEYKNDRKVNLLLKKLSEGAAAHEQAYEYAARAGEILADTYTKSISSEILPEGKMWYNIGSRVVAPTLEENCRMVSEYICEVQKQLNQAAGIGIKPVNPPVNMDRIKGIVDRLSSEEKFDDVSWILKEPVKTMARSVVDTFIKENVSFHGKAGMTPKIIRRSRGTCCSWCSKIEGVYYYPDVPEDVYRRHENCDCIVEYDPGSGKYQNVHTKQWSNDKDYDKIEVRRMVGLTEEEEILQFIRNQIIPRQNMTNIVERQEIHRVGTRMYENRKNELYNKGKYGPSYITISDEEILDIVKQYSGKGKIKYNSKGQWNSQEIVITNDKIIGVVVNDISGKSVETSVFKIHYGKNGIHIVPDYPSKKR